MSITIENVSEYFDEFANVPEGLLYRYILEAMKDLCKNTWLYQEVIAIKTTAGTYEYTLTPDTSTDEIIGIVPNGVQASTVNTPVPTATADAAGAGALTSGTTYYYKVSSVLNDYGESLPSEITSVAATATGEITIDWDAIDGANEYRVYRCLTEGGTYQLIKDDITDTEWTDDDSETIDTTVNPVTKSELMKDIGHSSGPHEGSMSGGWRQTEGSYISRIIWDGDSTIRTNVIPDTTGIGIQVKVALKPMIKQKDAVIPSIIEKNIEAVEDFVRWKLYMLPKSEDFYWSSQQIGFTWRKQYFRKRELIKNQVMSSYSNSLTAGPKGGSPWY